MSTQKNKDSMMKKILISIKTLGIVLILLPIISVFLWAGFDIQWWFPIDSAMDVRAIGLVMIHLLSVGVGGAFLIVTS